MSVTLSTPPAISVQVTPNAATVNVGVTSGSPVVKVTAGAAVLSGAVAGYNHLQATAADTWTIPHNLGYAPVIQAFTTGGLEIDGAVIHLTPFTSQVSFAGPIAGRARAV